MERLAQGIEFHGSIGKGLDDRSIDLASLFKEVVEDRIELENIVCHGIFSAQNDKMITYLQKNS